MSHRLSGPQKAAILLLSLGEDAAAEVLKNLSDSEIEEVSRNMARFGDVTPKDVDRVASEFYLIAEKGRFLNTPPETKVEFLKKILAKAIGPEKAAELVDGLMAAKPSGPLERLKWHDPATIARFLAGEHPQVIAVILANLGEPALMQHILAELPQALSQDVFARLLRLKSISPEWVEEIEASLAEELAREPGEGARPAHLGTERAAGLLNAAPPPMERAILNRIEQQAPAVAERIRAEMFPFPEFIKIDNQGLQKILARSTLQDVVLALHGADEALARHLLHNLSSDSAGKVQAALELPGPARLSDIEAAQKRLANIARDLAEKGELLILDKPHG